MKVVTICNSIENENTYVSYDEESLVGVIIDPGSDYDKILEVIDREELIIKYILLSHAHFDHMFSLGKLSSHLVCSYGVSKDDIELLEDDKLNLSTMFTGTTIKYKPDILFKDGDIINFGHNKLSVISTPGHTPGGCCFYDEDSEILFTGDSLFKSTIGRTDLYKGDEASLISSIKNKILTLPGNVTVYPGHGRKTTIADEIRSNQYFI